MKKAYLITSLPEAKACWEFQSKNWSGALAAGHPLYVEISTCEEKKNRIQLLKPYWVMMRHIEEMAWVEGRTFDGETWHEYFKRRLIGVLDLPGGGTMAISTSTLSDKEFIEYAGKVNAIAATELGVTWDN